MTTAPLSPDLVRTRNAEATAAPVAIRPAPSILASNAIHRPFFIAAIAITLTLGATWGAWLLWRIGLSGSFTAIGINEVNAHGEAQLFGWVGLFIMGFAYQAFPRMWQSRLPAPTLALVAFITMLSGLILRTMGMTAGEIVTATIGGGLQLVAVAIFLMQMLITMERRRAPFEPFMGFIMVALAWFGLSSVFSVWYTWVTMNATGREDLLFYVSTYQAALRDTQIHGVALMMILGVSMKVLPSMFGLPRISRTRAIAVLFVLAIAIAGETSFFIAYRWSEAPQLAGIVYAMWVLLAAGVASVILPWRIWRPMPLPDNRSGKFVRVAFIWLSISLIMLLLLPVYQIISGLPFSHAYYGAVRHAITVGFISMMIMGIGSKVIPALNGVPRRELSALWIPFILVNVGCAMRVGLQPLTDGSRSAFAILGVSGVLEVLGLGFWGVAMIRTMLRRRAIRPATDFVPINIESPRQPRACCSCCAEKAAKVTAAKPTSHAAEQAESSSRVSSSC